MKNILILIPLLFFFSCNNKQADDKLISRDSLDDILIGKKWEITKIDPLNTEDIRGTVFDFNANGSMKALYYDFETDNMALDKGTWNLRLGNELLINVPFLGGLEGTIIKYSDSIFVMEFKSESDTVLIDFSAREKIDKATKGISGTYTGNIDGSLEIVMALEQDNDKHINGLYYYKKHKKKIIISGIIESNEVFLNEYCNNEMTGKFTGKLTDDIIHGTWTNYDGSKKKDFFLKRTSDKDIASKRKEITSDRAAYNIYFNERFNFEVQIPAEYQSDPPPTNGDGLKYHSADNNIQLTAYGEHNVLYHSLEEEMNSTISFYSDYNISYKRIKENYFAISGTCKNKILYLKGLYNAQDDTYATVVIEYPQSIRSEMDDIVTTVSKSLRFRLNDKKKNIIHESIRDFKETKLILKTEKYKIRIDKMNDGTYRYASWTKSAEVSEKPDLIINNGKMIYYGSGGNYSYEFFNGEYKYECAVNIIGTESTPPAYLIIYKNNTRILQEDAYIAGK